jgi:quercetin dioxygenase-like cupin family protein
MNRHFARLFTTMALSSVGILPLACDRIAQAQQQAEIQRKLLLQQDMFIPGYQMIVQTVEIPAGVKEVRHTHPGVLSGYMLEGTLILEHEGRPTATYKAGETFVVDAGKIHQGINNTNAPAKLVATLVLEKGKPANTPAQ